MIVNADDPDTCALRVSGVDEEVPGRRRDHRRDTQDGSASRIQPMVASLTRRHLVLVPVAAESTDIQRFGGNRIRGVDLKILKRVRKVASLDLGMDHSSTRAVAGFGAQYTMRDPCECQAYAIAQARAILRRHPVAGGC